MASTLTLTFAGAQVADETFDFTGNGDVITFKNTRYNVNQVSIKSTIASQVQEFYKAFENDWNFGEYTVTYDETTVAISNIDNTFFDNFVDATHNGLSNVTTAVTTTQQEVDVVITPTFSEASTNKELNVDCALNFSVTINELRIYQYDSVDGTTEILNNTTFDNTDVTVTLQRKYTTLYVYYKIDGQAELFQAFSTPAEMEIVDTPFVDTKYGTLLKPVESTFIGSEENQYAIYETTNGVVPVNPELVYQNSKEFLVLPNEYVLYIKDKYGGVAIEQVTVPDDGVVEVRGRNTGIYISNRIEGSFRLRQNEKYGLTASNLNLVTEEFDDLLKIKDFYLYYSENQKSKFQFKTDYVNNTVNLVYCQEAESVGSEPEVIRKEITAVQKTSNLDKHTYLEGKVKVLSGYGGLAVFFVPGDIYNKLGSVIGQHTYDDTLPLWYAKGVTIKLLGQVSTIVDIVTVSGVQYAITGLSQDINETVTTIETVHTDVFFEVFEFNVDYSDTPADEFRIEVVGGKKLTTGIKKTYLSGAKFKVLSEADFREKKLHVCEFWSSKSDSQVNYYAGKNTVAKFGETSTKHLWNIPFQLPCKRITQGDVETESLDNKVVKIDFQTTHVYESRFDRMPAEVAGSLADCFNQTENFTMNGLICTTVGLASIEHIGNSGWAIPKVQYAVSELSTETGRVAFDIPDAYYPVNVTP